MSGDSDLQVRMHLLRHPQQQREAATNLCLANHAHDLFLKRLRPYLAPFMRDRRSREYTLVMTCLWFPVRRLGEVTKEDRSRI